jgi:hypothetical protein
MVSKRLNLSTVEEARAYIHKSKMLLTQATQLLKKKICYRCSRQRSRTAFKTSLGRHEEC